MLYIWLSGAACVGSAKWVRFRVCSIKGAFQQRCESPQVCVCVCVCVKTRDTVCELDVRFLKSDINKTHTFTWWSMGCVKIYWARMSPVKRIHLCINVRKHYLYYVAPPLFLLPVQTHIYLSIHLAKVSFVLYRLANIWSLSNKLANVRYLASRWEISGSRHLNINC